MHAIPLARWKPVSLAGQWPSVLRTRTRRVLRRLARRWLGLPNVYTIGRCSYCGLPLYSHHDYMLVVRKGWGRQRIALACPGCGSSAKTLKRSIKLKEV